MAQEKKLAHVAAEMNNPIVRIFALIEDGEVKKEVAEIFGLLKPRFQAVMACCLLATIRGEEVHPLRTPVLRQLYGQLEALVCHAPAVSVAPAPKPQREGLMQRLINKVCK